jgi:hypothetical protein
MVRRGDRQSPVAVVSLEPLSNPYHLLPMTHRDVAPFVPHALSGMLRLYGI